MVLTYLHFRILKFPMICGMCHNQLIINTHMLHVWYIYLFIKFPMTISCGQTYRSLHPMSKLLEVPSKILQAVRCAPWGHGVVLETVTSINWDIPRPGKRLQKTMENHGFLIGKSTISMGHVQ